MMNITKHDAGGKLLLLVGFSGKQFAISTEQVDELVDIQKLEWEKELLYETWETARYKGCALKVFFPFGKCCLVSKHCGIGDMYSVVLVSRRCEGADDIRGIMVDGVYGVVQEGAKPDSFQRFDVANLF